MDDRVLEISWLETPPQALADAVDSVRRRNVRGIEKTFEDLRRRFGARPLRPGSAHELPKSASTETPSLESLLFSRAAFGPTPADVETFRDLGLSPRDRLEAWVDWQLGDAPIPEPDLDLRLAESGYSTLDKNLEELWNDHLREDEDFEYRMMPLYETQLAAILRATYSRRQLAEVLADFWHNHFNVYGFHFFVGPVFVHYDRDVIRRHMLGNFREFLEEMTISPAMLFYLDNVFNSADGPNENFARELFELHTLGEENYFGAVPADEVPTYANGIAMGYTDEDVREFARCLTGWSLSEDDGSFLFRWYWHDRGEKKVLGRTIDSGLDGIRDVREVYDLLAAHPGVARFICRKLCRRLVADDPPETLVESVSAVFLNAADEPDQLRRVVRAILVSDEFASTWNDKVKRPFELVTGAVRAMEPSFPLPWTEDFSRLMFYLLYTTGNLPYTWAPPTGFPDRKEIWLTTNALVTSWRLINLLTGLDLGGWRPCDPLGATPQDRRTPNEIVDYWIDRVFLRTLNDVEREEMVDFMAQGADPDVPVNLAAWRNQERLRSMVGLVLMSPEYHWR